jgi:hypothetical protein
MMKPNSKIEIRNPKPIRSSKCQADFEIRISNLFRISKFGFRIFLIVALPIACAAAAIETATVLQQQGPASLSVRAKVERGQVAIRLTDSLPLTLTVEGSDALKVKPSTIKASEAIKVRSRSAPLLSAAGKDRLRWHQTFLLEPLVPGNHTIQVDSLEYRDQPGNWTSVKWQPVAVQVTTQIKAVDAKVEHIRDITNIEELPERPSPWRWLAWSLAGVAGAVLVLFIVRQIRKRRQHRTVALTPQQWAVRELERIVALNLPARGEVERFHTMLSNVVRRYLEKRFALPARRQTTPEFLAAMPNAPQLSAALQNRMHAFLERCDLAKFARAPVSNEECALTADMVRKILEENNHSEPERQAREE